MSGTSCDGVDAALMSIAGRGEGMSATYRHHVEHPFDGAFRKKLLDIRAAGGCSFAELATVGRELTLAYAKAVRDLLEATNTPASDIAAIAAHGQTLYHAPPNTIQWFDPSLLAAETGIAVVSDFRRADCAAGGQGAPLVPFADWVLFRHPTKTRIILNLGGIANLTYLPAGGGIEDVIAFDTGPGCCLSDWLMRNRGGKAGELLIDEGGELADSGVHNYEWQQATCYNMPFLQKNPPKSTDTNEMVSFYQAAREAVLVRISAPPKLEDELASIARFVAQSIQDAIVGHLPGLGGGIADIVVAGGGSQNRRLMRELRAITEVVGYPDEPRPTIVTSDDLGLPSQAREAACFAILGAATLDGEPSNVPNATGATRRVVLGSITPRTPHPAPPLPPAARSRPGHKLIVKRHQGFETAALAARPDNRVETSRIRAANVAPVPKPSTRVPTPVLRWTVDRSHLPTEQRLPESERLDELTALEVVALMNAQDQIAVAAVTAVREAVAAAAELVANQLRCGGRLVYFGAGTSGRLGVLDASECPPTFRTEPHQVQGIIAGGREAMFVAQEGAEDSIEGGAAAVDQLEMGENDVAFGIAAGGTTPYVRGALTRAKERGATTVFLACVPPGPNQGSADVEIRPITGPEVITGSTRLKAGTATKLVLNQVTTTAMVLLAKTYGNRMVDLRATNAKLVDRASRMVAELCDVDRDTAALLLNGAQGHVKVAVVMHMLAQDATTARATLRRAGGRLRDAIRMDS